MTIALQDAPAHCGTIEYHECPLCTGTIPADDTLRTSSDLEIRVLLYCEHCDTVFEHVSLCDGSTAAFAHDGRTKKSRHRRDTRVRCIRRARRLMRAQQRRRATSPSSLCPSVPSSLRAESN